MDESDLSSEHDKPYVPERDDWSYSPDQRVQLAQNQGALGNSASGIHSAGAEIERQKRKEKDNADFLEFAAAMEASEQNYLKSFHAAERSLHEFGDSLDSFRDNVARERSELDRNTIKLHDGTSVYYNTKTGRFERQNAQGQWRELDNKKDIDEAFAKARANGGIAATKQGKIILDRREQELQSGHDFITKEQHKLSKINADVKDGKLSYKEGTKETQGVTKDIKHQTATFDKLDHDDPTLVSAVVDQEQANMHDAKKMGDNYARQTGSVGDRNLFGSTDQAETQSPRTASAFGSALGTNQRLTPAFSQASGGASVPDAPQPEQKPSNSPSPSLSGTL